MPDRAARTLALVALLVTALAISRPTLGKMEIHWHAGLLSIGGDVSSAGHKAVMRDVAIVEFPAADHQFDFVIAAGMPPGWSLATEQALRAVARMQSGTATLSTEVVELDGFYSDAPGWRAALARLSSSLLPGMRLQDDSVAVGNGASLAELCQAQFDAALRGREIDFHLSSSELRPSAYPVLDAFVEITADCPAARIEVTGHTDSSGYETLNLLLSRKRAEAVVNYMEKRGINLLRLSARGAGASQPLDTGDTRAARARNRRIEFAVSFDQ